MAKPVSSSPFQAMEEEAYHAFREWPILLVMRQKELDMHLATVAATPAIAPTPAPSGETGAAAVDPRPVKQLELISRE
jgi:hypothetical protein